jgi:hypothetical protein
MAMKNPLKKVSEPLNGEPLGSLGSRCKCQNMNPLNPSLSMGQRFRVARGSSLHTCQN